MPEIYPHLRRLLFQLPPEEAHHLALRALDFAVRMPGVWALLRRLTQPLTSTPVRVFGLSMPNPIGIAAGFDKDGLHIKSLEALGFGFVEIGSVTARAWAGDPKPRIARVPAALAMVNKVGLPSRGAADVERRLSLAPHRSVPLFINIAKTADPAIVGNEAIQDYCESAERLRAHADVIVLNISCPNTADGRTFEDPEHLAHLLDSVMPVCHQTPVSVKVSPDLDRTVLRELVSVAIERGVAGFTATNTTRSHAGLQASKLPPRLRDSGGVSGAPLRELALRTVRVISEETHGAVPIVGLGGCMSALDAARFFDAGATLIQVYSALVYNGPSVVRQLCS